MRFFAKFDLLEIGAIFVILSIACMFIPNYTIRLFVAEIISVIWLYVILKNREVLL